MKPSLQSNPYLRAFNAGAAVAAAIVLTPHFAKAADFIWDPGNTANGATIDPGNGTWNTTAGNVVWNSAGTNVIWSGNNTAVFGGADGTYSVTLGANITSTAVLVNFQNSGYTISAAAAQSLTSSFSSSTSAANNLTAATQAKSIIWVGLGKTASIGSNVTFVSSGGSFGSLIGLAGTGSVLNLAAGSTLNRTVANDLIFASAQGGGTGTVNVAGTIQRTNASDTSAVIIGQWSGDSTEMNVNSGGLISTASAGTGNSNSGSILVGNNSGSIGVLNIKAGAAVTSTSTNANAGLKLAQSSGSTGTANLDGGVLTVQKVGMGAGTGTFNFNGGTLKAVTSTTTFMTGLTAANVKAGGALIDSNNFDVTIGQALLHDSGLGATPDGGLTKSNTGVLTLSSANTYTGATTISGGTLALGGTVGALSTSSAITNNGTLTINRTNAVVQGTDFSGASITGTGALSQFGTGSTLTLNTANGYAGTTTIGAAQNNSVLRATATGALGSGTIQLDGTGNASTARLELTGGITLANPTIQLAGRNNATVGIQSISGNNTLSGAINLQSGGSTYTVQSDADLLTLSGGIANAFNTGTRTLTVTGAGATLISGVIGNGTGTTALTKSGGGTLTLDNTNTYSGATAVSAGTLLVNGALGNTATAVSLGATLGGTGSIAGAVTVAAGGFLSPGASIESLDVASAAISGTLITEYDGTGAGTIDLLGVTGILDITAATVDFNQIGAALSGPSYVFANYGTLAGSQFATVTDVPTGYEINYAFGGNNIALVAIPEPAAALLGGLGVLALLRRRR